MTMTAAQYQKQLDDDADFEQAVDRAREDCRGSLIDLEPWHYQERIRPWAKGWLTVGDEDMNNALIGECLKDLELARSLLDSNPVGAMRILDECRARAADDVVGRMDFERIVNDNNDEGIAA